MKRVQWNRFMGKLPPNTKLVTRRSRWGNIYELDDYTLEESLRLYKIWLDKQIEENPTFLDELRGYDLACACPLNQDCHANIIMEVMK